MEALKNKSDGIQAILCAPFEKKKQARRGKIALLYEIKRHGWTGPLPLYLFACPNPDCINHTRLTVDYPHGFPGVNMRVTCFHCGANKYFAKSSVKEVLELIRFIYQCCSLRLKNLINKKS